VDERRRGGGVGHRQDVHKRQNFGPKSCNIFGKDTPPPVHGRGIRKSPRGFIMLLNYYFFTGYFFFLLFFTYLYILVFIC